MSGATGGGGGGGGEQSVSLLLNESLPKLSLTQFAEPTTPNSFPVGAIPAEPTDLLSLRFSAPIDQSFTKDDFEVSIKRPLGEFMRVPIERAFPLTDRTVCLKLVGSTLHNSMYRVRAGGVRTPAGATPTGTQQSFFVVRDGIWAQPELISLGGVAAGGLAITPDLNLFATVEANADLSPGLLWTTSVLGARFGSPWQFPETVFTRTAVGSEDGVQLQTGGLNFTDQVGFYRFGDGDPNEGDARNYNMLSRVAVGLLTPNDGLQFGDAVNVVSATDTRGRIDQPLLNDSDELGAEHFTMNPVLVADGRSVGAAFWSLSAPADTPTSPGTSQDLTEQKVYGSHTMAPGFPASGNVADIEWADWDPATTLSATSELHNSWPAVTQFEDGHAIAFWWSASTTEAIFDDQVRDYWMATYDPATGWGTALNATPPGEVGQLPPVTDIEAIEGVAGTTFTDEHLVVFSRDQGVPSARLLNLVTLTWATSGTTPAIIAPATGYTTFKTPTVDNYVVRDAFGALPYGGQLRPNVGKMTPKASSSGANEFLVQWTDVDSGSRIYVAEYCPGNLAPWGDAEDLSSFANISSSPNQLSNAGVSLGVDENGWATLLYRVPEVLPSGFTRNTLFARRTNLPVSGAAGLSDVLNVSVAISPLGFDAKFPSRSNTHSSGALAVSWSFRIHDEDPDPIGSVVARFR